MIAIEWEVVLFFVLGVLLLYGIGWLLLVPFRKALWFLLNSVLGIIVLLMVGHFGQGAGIVAVANPFSAIVTGFLGVPGVVLVLLVQNLL